MFFRQILVLAFLLPFQAIAGDNRSEVQIITSRADLEQHLQAAHEMGSPLLYLSEPGRRYFLEQLLVTPAEVVPVNHAPLRLELNAQQMREILALFGFERMASVNNDDFQKVDVRRSDHLEDYYQFLRELQALRDGEGVPQYVSFRSSLPGLLEKYFGNHLLEAALREQGPADLKLLYEAVRNVFFHTSDPTLLRFHENIVAVLQARWRQDFDAAEWNQLANATYQSMLIAREFDRAKQFAHRYNIEPVEWRLDPLPPSAEDNLPAVLDVRLTGDGIHLSSRVIEVAEGSQIVAVVSQGCPFSRRAMEVVESEPRLQVLLRGRTEWVTDQRESQYADAIAKRNATARETVMSIAYKESDWPDAIQFGQWPVFYLFKDGELQEKIVGWPNDEQAEVLAEAVRRLGALAADE